MSKQKVFACNVFIAYTFFFKEMLGIPCRLFGPSESNCTMDIFRFRINTEPVVPNINYTFHCEGDLTFNEVYEAVETAISTMGFPLKIVFDGAVQPTCDYKSPSRFIALSRLTFTEADHNKVVECRQNLPNTTVDGWSFGKSFVKAYTVKISRIDKVEIIGRSYVEVGGRYSWTCAVEGVGLDDEKQVDMGWRVTDANRSETLVPTDRKRVIVPSFDNGTLKLYNMNETMTFTIEEDDSDVLLGCVVKLNWFAPSKINILQSHAYKYIMSFKTSTPWITGPKEVLSATNYTWQCHFQGVEWEVQHQVTVDFFVRELLTLPVDVSCSSAPSGRRTFHSCVYTFDYFVPANTDNFEVECCLTHHAISVIRLKSLEVIVKESTLAERVEYMAASDEEPTSVTLPPSFTSKDGDPGVLLALLILLGLFFLAFLAWAVWKQGCCSKDRGEEEKGLNLDAVKKMMDELQQLASSEKALELPAVCLVVEPETNADKSVIEEVSSDSDDSPSSESEYVEPELPSNEQGKITPSLDSFESFIRFPN